MNALAQIVLGGLDLSEGHWFAVKDGDPRARALYLRHYSASPTAPRHGARGNLERFVGPGEKLVLLTPDCRALFAWRRELFRLDGQTGVNCAIFRNEGPTLSSLLIREASALAWRRWPGERLWTYVNPDRIRSTNPGACYLKAGWRRLKERSAGGLVILEVAP